MKRLTVVRHAKASRDAPSLRDSGRPLSAHGQRDAERVADLLACAPGVPECVLCSAAVRARATLDAILKVCPDARGRELIREDLYLAPAAHWLSALQELPETCAHVMLVGHNPGLHELVETLTGMTVESFPTLAVAHLCGGPGSWLRIQPGDFRLTALASPRHPRG
jgi:phosphohistidine phosphatase